MAGRTTPRERREFYRRHLRGETYQEIADSEGISKACVRYWCRRQRDGGSCQTSYRRAAGGLLGRFDPLVRYWILRLRLRHPRWGPNRIRERLIKLQKKGKPHSSLRGLALPSDASIGRYLHQWPRFRRRPKETTEKKRPREPTAVHECWQLDFKLGIALLNGQLVNLHAVRDPVGEACMAANVFPAGQVGHNPQRPTIEQARYVLRTGFARWDTLPDYVQTDGEPALVGKPQDSFPSHFTLWLIGLGIDHVVIRPGTPTDDAEVERCHRTLNDYAIVGNERADRVQLQQILDQAVYELNHELSSRAEGCNGLPPIVAHPELLQPRRAFRPEHELAIFDLKRVDDYLATFTLTRKVSKTGQISIGGSHQYYSVGRTYARRHILVRFDPADRHFVFSEPEDPDREIGRRPARNLEISDITGLAAWPIGLGPQQLPLPLFAPQGGYVLYEQVGV